MPPRLAMLPSEVGWLLGFARDCDDLTSWTRIQFAGSIFGFIELTAVEEKLERRNF